MAGGSILQGVLRIGDEIEVRPGIVSKEADGSMKCTPIYSRIMSLYAEQNDLKYAVPGGLIGVGTKIDPTLTRAGRSIYTYIYNTYIHKRIYCLFIIMQRIYLCTNATLASLYHMYIATVLFINTNTHIIYTRMQIV